MLFSDASLHTLGFIKAGQLDAEKFVKLIAEANPQFIFDLRPVPSFARRALTRDAVFTLFEKYGVKYHDVAGVLGVSAGRDALLNPSLLIRALQVSVLHRANGLIGPVFFFVNDDLFTDEYFSEVAKHLPHQDGRGWDIACWPNEPIVEAHRRRDLVFISHANPEDNEVALWLASRLAAGGYQVWSDVTRLIGGEVFWDTIEEAIRNRAAKVIVVLSRRGHKKPGLLDEVNIAVSTERSEERERFVIPIRVDDLPFTDIRANLARKNVIDGHRNLADALSRVFAILREDAVPRLDAEPNQLFQRLETRQQKTDRSEWSLLLENKIELLKWPRVIRKFRSAASSYPFVAHPVAKGAVTFEEWNHVEAALGPSVARAGEAVFEIEQNSSALALVFSSHNEARQAAASLLRQAWDRMCQARGFERYILASGAACWFVPNTSQNPNRVRYIDPKGIERHKNLLGQSPRRRVFWHFGVEARPNVTDSSIRLVPHVVFTEDGRTPIASHDRQHSLRRGFCRNWWNARWRDLLIATLTYMSEGADRLVLPVSANEGIEVSSQLKKHIIPTINGIESTAERNTVFQFEEPRVAVGHGQTDDDPKEGLLLFGPVAFDRNPKDIRVGVIGTPEGIELFHLWSRQFNAFQADTGETRNSVPFPGFEAVFGARWGAPVHTIPLSRTDLISAILLEDRHVAIYKSSGMYVERIVAAVRDDDVDVSLWFVVIPDEVFLYGRPASRVPPSLAVATPEAMGRYVARRFLGSSPSLFPEDNQEAEIYDYQLDFHHQLKARLLGVQAVTQILRESSLATTIAATVPEIPAAPDLVAHADADDADALEYESDPLVELDTDALDYEVLSEDDEMRQVQSENDLRIHASELALNRQMQDKASVAWNLSTAAFFKSGGRPWRVANARQSVCYIGLIFKRDTNVRSRQSCCGAQMFLQDSEGLVFKGAMGPWYSPTTGQFHLSRAEAARLIGTVLQSYGAEHPEPPRELFIHGRTRFSGEEWAGFCDAIDVQKTRLVAVRITRSNEYKLFSSGERAVRRGTAIQLSARVGLLWTSGYIERLGTYPGRETPNPLRIEIVNDSQRSPSIETVMSDILMLTKMNFNSCIYGDGLPVTMRFAEAIGDVMITAKDEVVPPLPFRYYI